MKTYGKYGLLLGTLLTVAYGYAAQAAMARDLTRARPEEAVRSATPGDGRIWYGGMLAPITVQGWRPEPSAIGRRAAPRVPSGRGRGVTTTRET